MSIFPARILLATDGSEEAELAALKAVELADNTDADRRRLLVRVYERAVGRQGPALATDVSEEANLAARARPSHLLGSCGAAAVLAQ